jgi:hypothetical protein
MTVRLQTDRRRIEAFCRRNQVQLLALFGSVLRDDFGPDSDVDVLVSFSRDAHWGLRDLVRMQDELKEIFGRDVDLVTRSSIEQSPNYIRRNHILRDMETLYVAG